MKLYTEEQIINTVWKFAPFVGRTAILVELNSLTLIELSSNEEIMYMSLPKKGGSHSSDYMEGFNKGAKWVIEQIKQHEK